MNYKDKLVGDVELAPDAPAWLVQLAGSLQNVDRDEYLKQIEDFNVSIKAQGRTQAVAMARDLVVQFGLEKGDVFQSTRKAVVPAKYRDPATGKTWSGRGKAPVWLAGKDRAGFKV